ncbi:GNAT family N-acetyltransferase [Pseudoxanthomonas indica]|uniref:Acetyltransferase (GNAT) domain-containing protein n=1 Tax=Pseudoxanthomonas indica TaxID=428993 RepID=A0A1T5LPR7_9GAMM|nr:GNAT family N-acetyltransferase [Pseudoxanthomonas indica]GGD37725.1 AttT protein [Pseudoxanthomonas indica]SKC77901.1 Acetyltransferase (GNAT) domain-containing protein [Pseudoxanthomonas indica]
MTLPEGYTLQARVPDIDDVLRLRVESGLSPRTRAAAEAGLPNSLFGVTLMHDGQAIGMGRIIGDGGCSFVIVDIAVQPAHQKRGLGRAIMDALDAWLKAHAPDGAHISLIADGDARHLYARYGFKDVGPASIGMQYTLRR